MNRKDTGTLVIRFVDGTEEKFEYARHPQDDANLAARIQEVLNANHLLVEFEGKMVIYPFHGIKSIEVSPVPEKLPRIVIRKPDLPHKKK
jgi:hypothetical protein